MSNHEAGRLAYLKQQIIENHCVFDPKDVHIDAYGALVWTIEDPDVCSPFTPFISLCHPLNSF